MCTPAPPIPPGKSGIDDLIYAKPSAKALGDIVAEIAKELGAGSESQANWGIRAAHSLITSQSFLGNLLATVINIITPLVLFFLKTLTNLREDTVDAQVELSEATLSEFLATDVKVSGYKCGKDHAGTVAAAESIGNALYAQLTSEFAPGGVVTPESGEAAAKKFSGFAVNFAVQNAIISTLTDALSLHLLEDFRELGVGVARNLGIGRLQRMALGTLLKNTIQTPYDHALQARYRPNKLTDAEYVHAYHRGDIDRPTLGTHLAQAGYKEAEIPFVIAEHADKLTTAELLTLVRFDKLKEDAAVTLLQAQGLDSIAAGMRLQAAELAILSGNIRAYVDSLNVQVRKCAMTVEKWNDLMTAVPWTADEIDWERKANGVYREYYDHMLTWTQVITAYENGIVDVDYVEAWLSSKQYSPEDILNMELLLAVKFDAFAAAAAKKGATAKPAPTPKPAP